MEIAEPRKRADWVVLSAALALTGLGLVVVYSTSYPLALGKEHADAAAYLKRSLAFGTVGLAACFAAAHLRAEALRAYAYPALGLSIVLLALIWVPSLGVVVNGARRWVRLGGVGFQPSEVAKLALVVFLAHSLAKRGEKVRSFAYGFLPNMILPAIPTVLILAEPDLGTAAVLAALVAAMAYVGGVRRRHLALCVASALPVLVYLVWFVDFRRDRILAFLDPWRYQRGAGFQLVQSLVAFGTGGVWGVGLGASGQKLYYLPEAHTDFILSVWAEEKGLVGVLVVLSLAAVLVARGYAIALRQADPFRRLLATGLSTWLGIQGGVNALVVMGWLPTKGLPFPFLSYGGTGLVMTLTAAGLLAGLAREA